MGPPRVHPGQDPDPTLISDRHSPHSARITPDPEDSQTHLPLCHPRFNGWVHKVGSEMTSRLHKNNRPCRLHVKGGRAVFLMNLEGGRGELGFTLVRC